MLELSELQAIKLNRTLSNKTRSYIVELDDKIDDNIKKAGLVENKKIIKDTNIEYTMRTYMIFNPNVLGENVEINVLLDYSIESINVEPWLSVDPKTIDFYPNNDEKHLAVISINGNSNLMLLSDVSEYLLKIIKESVTNE